MQIEKNFNSWLKYNPDVAKIVFEVSEKFGISRTNSILLEFLEHHTENYGKVNKIKVNKYEKCVYLAQGVIVSSLRQLSTFFNVDKDKIRLFINELIEKKILVKVNLFNKQIKYAWNYIYTTIKKKQPDHKKENKNNFKKIKKKKCIETENEVENNSPYSWKTCDLQENKEKTEDKNAVTDSFSVQLKNAPTNYINIKDNKDKILNSTNTNIRTEDEQMPQVFDPTYGQSDEKIQKPLSCDDFKGKTENLFRVPYGKNNKTTSQKPKFEYCVREVSREEMEEQEMTRKSEKAISYFFGETAFLYLSQMVIAKGIASVYRFFNGKTKNCKPEEVLAEMRQDEYIARHGIDKSLERILRKNEV